MTAYTQRLRRIALVCLLACAGLAAAATSAFASHGRYGTISLQITDPTHPNVVTVRFDSAWRRTFFGAPLVGNTIALGGTIEIRNSVNTLITSLTVNPTVTSINTAEDWLTSTEQWIVTLPVTAAGTSPAPVYTFTFNLCCRLSTLHDSNNDLSEIVSAGIPVPAAGGFVYQPPTSATLPILYVAAGVPNVFVLPAVDVNGFAPTFSLSSAAASGLNRPAPAGLTLSAGGQVNWTPPTGAAAAGLYALQVRISDPSGAYSTVDFLLDVLAPSGPAPTVLVNNSTLPLTITTTVGSPVSFTVSADSNSPAGRVLQLSTGTLPLGAALSPGLPISASAPSSNFSWPSAAIGTWTMNFAAFDTGYGSQDTNSVTLIVNKAASVTTVSTNLTPSTLGQSVTFAAHVAPQSGSVVPSGTVQFEVDGVAIGSPVAINASGNASASFTTVPVGTHTIAAFYPGDANLASSTGTTTQVVNKASTTTTLDPMSSSPVGQPVAFVAHVSAVAPASGTPSGPVEFFDGMTSLGSASLSGGTATFTTASLTGGSHTITANYAGDPNFDGSSAVGTKTMTPVSPAIVASGSPNPSTFGQTVVITATVTGAPSVAPTGTVTFSEGVNTFGTSSLVGGVATITLVNTNVGPHTIAANYNGDASYNTAQSNASITVNKATPSVVVTSNINPAAFLQVVTFTATVTAPAGSPNGTITFSIDGVQIANPGVSVTGTTGTATFPNGAMNVGAHVITATYNGNGLLTPASGSVGETISTPAAPPFSQSLPMPPGACICTPLVMNTTAVGEQHWFAKAGGSSMTITAFAHAVNSADPETVVMHVFDASNLEVMGSPVTAAYPAGTAANTEASASITLPTTQGDVYRVAISTPNTLPTQPHYRLKFDGASEAAITPINSIESLNADAQRYYFNVAAGEQLAARIFPSAFISNGFAKNISLRVFDTAHPGVPVTVLDPLGNPVTTLTLSNPNGAAATVNFATAPSASSVYELVVTAADGHYRISRLVSQVIDMTTVGPNADTGVYLSWDSGGSGTVHVTVSSSAPFAGTVHVSGSSIDLIAIDTGNGEDLPLGTTVVDEANVGHYHLTFTAPAGFVVTPSEIDLDVLCDATTNIELTITQATIATISAPAVTYGQPGAVTVSVAGTDGPAAGSVSLTVDGGVVLTQPLASGSSVFLVPGLSAGDHALAASFAAQNGYVASDATGTIHVDKATPSILVTPYNDVYNGLSHTAAGTVTGVLGEMLAGLDLSATTHTNAGTYNGDAWTFTDATGNYTNASGTVDDVIRKATVTVTVNGYAVTYDGAAHTATATAAGAQGASIAGLDLSGTTHVNAGHFTDTWTFVDANGNYENATGTVDDVIEKAVARITVAAYNVPYDAQAHTATGTATGVLGETLAGLNLGGTTHTSAGDYNGDAWTFTDTTGNYRDAGGTVNDRISRANAVVVVTPYAVTYNGTSHTATGTAKGVLGESLTGLNLAGTAHTNAGSYTDTWTFTDATGNYASVSGSVNDQIAKANASIVVTPYNVTYDAAPHSATGTATGVLGEALAGLNLAGTTHTAPGAYGDGWTFVDQTGNYNNAAGSVNDSIAKAASATALAVSSANSASGQTVTFTATVSSAGGVPTGSVQFVVDGANSGAPVTLVNGVAAFPTSSLAVGPHTVVAVYSGSGNHLASTSAPVSHLVYALTAGGNFVIGDLNSAVGTAVTFWSAQWDKANALSGPTANASFKGFANNVGASAWTTDPGNSSNPPASIGSYIAVIVASTTSKSGPTISGNTIRVVIVKTNGGYGADPGLAGTGTVVAILP